MMRPQVSVKSVTRYVNCATKKTGRTRRSPFGDSNHAGLRKHITSASPQNDTFLYCPNGDAFYARRPL